jgi:hypothetical protein
MTNAKHEDVTVVLEPDNKPNFHLKSHLLKGDKLVFKNDHFPGFTVDFTIEDPTNSGYLFPSDPKMALGARKLTNSSDACPAQGDSWKQFEPESVSTDFKTLTVRNLNEFATEFGFTLFVTQSPNPPHGPYLPLDPIGENQNGPPSLDGGIGGGGTSTSVNWSYLAIGAGVVVLALIALVKAGVFGG